VQQSQGGQGLKHIERIKQLPCVACLQMGITNYGVDAHHILRGGRRIGDDHVLPLCPPHHRGHLNNETAVSRHPWRKAFEARYGSEEQLLEIVNEMLEEVA
jgi:hypothetical protein